jgi:hypothetical protein
MPVTTFQNPYNVSTQATQVTTGEHVPDRFESLLVDLFGEDEPAQEPQDLPEINDLFLEDEPEDNAYEVQWRAEMKLGRETTQLLLQASYHMDQYDQDMQATICELFVVSFDRFFRVVSPEESHAWPNIHWEVRVTPNVYSATSVDMHHYFRLEFFSRSASWRDDSFENDEPADAPDDAPRELWLSVMYEGPAELVELQHEHQVP